MKHSNRTRSLPDGCITAKTYAEFDERIRQFVEGKLALLLVIGEPGISKSQSIRHALQHIDHLYLETHSTALGMYQRLHEHRNMPVVIDDLDGIYADKAAVRLLKSVCNTDASKTLKWNSNHSSIGDGEGKTPREFTTTSKVCLIANEWKCSNVNVRAIQDRAIVLYFDPDPVEIHRQVGAWFDDREVYEFIGSHLHLIIRPSMRLYVKGGQLRQAASSRWREDVLTMAGVDEKTRVIAELQTDLTLNENGRIEAFMARTSCARSTYFAAKRKMPPKVEVETTLPVRSEDRSSETTTTSTSTSSPQASGQSVVQVHRFAVDKSGLA